MYMILRWNDYCDLAGWKDLASQVLHWSPVKRWAAFKTPLLDDDDDGYEDEEEDDDDDDGDPNT